MKTTIAIDTERVLEHLYAFSALDFFTDKSPRPEILGRDNKEALLCLMRHCAAELVYRLSPHVCGTNLCDETPNRLITVDFELPDEPSHYLSIRPLLEAALAATVMSTAYSGSRATLSATYGKLYERNMASALTMLAASERPGFIRKAM